MKHHSCFYFELHPGIFHARYGRPILPQRFAYCAVVLLSQTRNLYFHRNIRSLSFSFSQHPYTPQHFYSPHSCNSTHIVYMLLTNVKFSQKLCFSILQQTHILCCYLIAASIDKSIFYRYFQYRTPQRVRVHYQVQKFFPEPPYNKKRTSPFI